MCFAYDAFQCANETGTIAAWLTSHCVRKLCYSCAAYSPSFAVSLALLIQTKYMHTFDVSFVVEFVSYGVAHVCQKSPYIDVSLWLSQLSIAVLLFIIVMCSLFVCERREWIDRRRKPCGRPFLVCIYIYIHA